MTTAPHECVGDGLGVAAGSRDVWRKILIEQENLGRQDSRRCASMLFARASERRGVVRGREHCCGDWRGRFHRRPSRRRPVWQRVRRRPCGRLKPLDELVPGLRRRRQPPARPAGLRRLPRGRRRASDTSTTSPPTWAAWASSRTTRRCACSRCSSTRTCCMAARERRRRALLLLLLGLRLRRRQADATPTSRPLKEADAYPAMPEDGYGWEKLFSERMCRHFREDFGLDDARRPLPQRLRPPRHLGRRPREGAAAICRKVIEAKLSGQSRDRDLGRRRADPQLHVHRRLPVRHAGDHGQRHRRADQPRQRASSSRSTSWSTSSRTSPASSSSGSYNLDAPRRASAAATATTR